MFRARGRRVRAAHRGAFALAMAMASVLAASGCSSPNSEASKSPDRIFADAQQATGSASSVHISGRLTISGQPVSVNIVDGQSAGGGVVSESGVTIHLVLVHSKIYLEAGVASWKKMVRNGALADLLANKWLQTSASNPDFSTLSAMLDISKLSESLAPDSVLSKGGVTTFGRRSVDAIFDRMPVIPLHDGEGGTLYVEASGHHYIAGIKGGGANSGTLVFDQYGVAPIPKAPSGAVNLSQLEGQ